MPTAAKLVAATLFAALGFLAAELFKPLLPEGTQFGFFSEIVAVIGAFSGWFVVGTQAGRGMALSITAGVQTTVTLVFFALVGFGIYQMVMRSLHLRYDGVMEALMGAFGLMLENGALMLNGPLLGTLLAGSILGGVLTEVAARRWS